MCAAALTYDKMFLVQLAQVLPHHMMFSEPCFRAVWFAILLLHGEQLYSEQQMSASGASGASIDIAGIAGVLRSYPSSLYQQISSQVQQSAAPLWDWYRRNVKNGALRDLACAGEQTLFDQIDGEKTLQLVSQAEPLIQEAAMRHAQRIAEAYFKRRLALSLSQMHEAIRTNPNYTLDHAVERLSNCMMAFVRASAGVQALPASEIADAITKEKVREQQASGQDILTGYEALDRVLDGLRPGGTYIIAARPGNGKTTFALGIALHVAQQFPVLFVSLEVDKRDVVRGLVSAHHRLSQRDTKKCPAEYWRSLVEQVPHLERIRIADMAEVTAHSLRALVAYQTSVTNPVRLVIIDYLQLLAKSDSRQTEYEAVTENSRLIKLLSVQYGVPIIALSQMSRDIERQNSVKREPTLADLRSSGAIEQDANAVIFLHHVSTEHTFAGEQRIIKVKVAKNRFGPLESVWMDFFPHQTVFLPGRPPEQPPPEEPEERRRLRSALKH
ncbi:MAG: DnaB helicase C-terminal domain-containing protein [Rectinema sp.]|nr:DnaB helicase C-terminal domain-containing protein [Rectinema sp.]